MKMFRFVKRIFISTMFFSCNLCKVRPEIVHVNSNKPAFYPFSIKTSKCSDSCNNINDPYAQLCAPDVVKNINIKVFNLMSRTNEPRHKVERNL